MTIIIKTPQPDLEERLIVVDEATFAALLAALPGPLPVPRDAEPADLERAGWVRDSDLLALTVRAEAAEAERDEARDTIARARGCITDVPAGVRNALDIEVARLLRERDEARAERDEVRLILDASAGETTADAATRLHNDWVDARERADRVERERAVDAISGRARAAIVERDEARAALVKWQGSAEHERARCVAWLRSEVPHLFGRTATVVDGLADRLERGEHAGTPVPEPLPRATDEELVDLFAATFDAQIAWRPAAASRRAAVAAVAARVRREQCLVTRAVEAGCDVAFELYSRGVDASVPRADVSVSRPRVGSDGGEFFEGDLVERSQNNISPADVPKTLARLLGEVTR